MNESVRTIEHNILVGGVRERGSFTNHAPRERDKTERSSKHAMGGLWKALSEVIPLSPSHITT